MLRKTIFVILLAAIAVSGFWAADVAKDREHQLMVVALTPYFTTKDEAVAQAYKQQKQHVVAAGSLAPGEPVQVLRLTSTKSYLFINLERKDGSQVWVQYGSGVQLTPPPSA